MADTNPTLALYNRALDGFDAALAAVPDDAWANQSPCADWKAVDVASHVIGVQHHVVATLGGAAGTPPTDLAGGDALAAFRAVRADLAQAAAAPGALEQVVDSPFGKMPAANFLGVLVADAVTHTWDLAKAAGIDITLDPELVGIVQAALTPMDEAIRRPGAFDAKVAAPADADDQTKLMAFLGRKVQDWA